MAWITPVLVPCVSGISVYIYKPSGSVHINILSEVLERGKSSLLLEHVLQSSSFSILSNIGYGVFLIRVSPRLKKLINHIQHLSIYLPTPTIPNLPQINTPRMEYEGHTVHANMHIYLQRTRVAVHRYVP
jgi:hypothetical protein